MSCAPVLFVVFNRPEVTARVFAAIRSARPPRLYVAADGPRPDRPGEAERCAEVRRIATQVDWPCEVRTLFRETNLGCGRAVYAAISWFFEQEEAGIILEDDCLPDPTFFPFCTELLERYRDDARIFTISGDNFQFGRSRTRDSYYFSRYPQIWGWATWRRTWQLYDFEMKRWPELRETTWLRDILQDCRAERYWREIFDGTHAGRIDTWDYQLIFSCWVGGGLCAIPRKNLISNIGYAPDGTRTICPISHLANLPTYKLPSPLRHPRSVQRDAVADRFDQYHRFDQSLAVKIRCRCQRLLVAIKILLSGK